MQTVTQAFREQEYSGEALFNCILRINDNLVPVQQIASIKIKSPIIDTSTETFYVGTFISQTVTIKFKNLDGLDIQSKYNVHLEIGQNVEGTYTYLPMGEYLIDDLAENYQETCEITCMDYAIKFKPNVDYSPCFTDGKANVNTIIQYICNYFNVELGSNLSLLPNPNVEVGTYDSTVSGKQWLSYLAEIKGCNLKMSRDGKLLFIPFVRDSADVEIDALKSAEWEVGEKYQLTRIVYFDAIRNYTKGDESGNTLFIRQDNPFITDESVIDNLANQMIFNTQETSQFKDITISDGNSVAPASIQIYGDIYQDEEPSPSSPQDIEVVTGNNNLYLTCKNLLQVPSSITQEINNLTFTLNEDGSISISGTSSAVTRITLNLDNPIALNGEYTFSLKTVGTISTNSQQQWILRNANNNWLLRPAVRSNITSKETYTRNDIATKLEIYTASGITLDCTIYPQLEKNSTYTDYEQCHSKVLPLNLGTIELCKLGTYQDYIYKNDDKWYVHKEIEKLTLNGSENWDYYSDSRWKYRLVVNGILPFANDNYTTPSTIKSNLFTPTYWTNTDNNGKFTGMRDINTTISFANTDITSLANWKTWLSTNNTIVYYVLNTATDIEITDGELITSLNTLNKFTLYDDTNNIYSLSYNVNPYLKLSYGVNKNFTIWSLKNKNYGDISLDAWDIIQFNLGNESYWTYNDNELTYEMNISTIISTQIPNKQKEITTNVKGGDIPTNIKMLKTTLDYVKNQISLLLTETSGLEERTNQLVMDILSTQNIFQITGGSNLIQNSQFLYPDDNSELWTFTNNGSNPFNNMGDGYDANLIGKTTSVSKIQLRDTILESSTTNIVNIKKNQTYNLGFSYTQDALTTTRVQLIEGTTSAVIFDKTYNEQVNTITNENLSFLANDTNYIFKVTTTTTSGNTNTGYFNIYDLMLNSGDKKNWEPAKSEVYSTVVKMSQMGLSIFATGSNIVTLLTSQGFQIRKYVNGQIGIIPITEFTDTGIITGDIESDSISTGKYISTEMMINGVEHHVEYFKE